MTTPSAPINVNDKNPRPSFWRPFGIGCLTGFALEIITVKSLGQFPVPLWNWFVVLAYPVALVAGFLCMSWAKSKYRFLGYLLPVVFSWMLALLFAFVILPAWLQAVVGGA